MHVQSLQCSVLLSRAASLHEVCMEARAVTAGLPAVPVTGGGRLFVRSRAVRPHIRVVFITCGGGVDMPVQGHKDTGSRDYGI